MNSMRFQPQCIRRVTPTVLIKTKSASALLRRAALLLILVSFHSSFSTAFARLVRSFPNPTPAVSDAFGYSMASVGNDRVLIGVPHDVGVARLFSTNGTLLITFTNPTPANDDIFGVSVAAVGTDRVLIGASNDDTGAQDAGAAYLFSTNGTLLATFTNPTPAAQDNFGNPVAAVGSDRVLIGARFDNTGALGAGAAYLFSTNRTRLTTFTNPTPAVSDQFGSSLAALDIDRVLIGAPYDDTGGTDAGAAYLFSTNGTLLTTFTNPTPTVGDGFGAPVAAVGSDRVLIGASGDNTGGTDAGAAYLFSTNGTLLITFTNPTPAVGDGFGASVAAVGSDRVLIGAYGDNTGATDAGSAYLFSTNGTLLTTFTNPTPAASDYFSLSVAVVGSDRVLIAAPYDDTGATDAGTAYLFNAPGQPPDRPTLTLTFTTTNTVLLSWPYPSTDFVLEQNPILGTTNWTGVTNAVTTNGSFNRVIISPNPSNNFYRLKK
jgi:hypothetical protein